MAVTPKKLVAAQQLTASAATMDWLELEIKALLKQLVR